MSFYSTVLFFLIATPLIAGDVQRFSFPVAPEMGRADVYVTITVPMPKAILVLCPGRNGSAEEWMKQKEWLDFAKGNELGLVGISFASPDSAIPDAHGYWFAAQGSGQLLLNALHKIYGRDLPILLYGFSAGAVFTNQFVDWKPDRVIAWSAYAGDDNEQTKNENSPPGINACGEYDGGHYGASLSYFKQGRAFGKPWLWVSLSKTEHARSPSLEEFTREYFQSVMQKEKAPCWVDIDLKKEITFSEAGQLPSVSGWLPDQKLLETWMKLHEP